MILAPFIGSCHALFWKGQMQHEFPWLPFPCLALEPELSVLGLGIKSQQSEGRVLHPIQVLLQHGHQSGELGSWVKPEADSGPLLVRESLLNLSDEGGRQHEWRELDRGLVEEVAKENTNIRNQRQIQRGGINPAVITNRVLNRGSRS